MDRRTHHLGYHLDPHGIQELAEEDIKAILRGADAMIMSGGRSLLAKLLKGSRARKVRELGLERNPVYGHYRDLTEPEILARIDWMVLEGFLDIEYDFRFPLLKFTDKGWEIEKETMVEELLHGFATLLTTSPPPWDLTYLKEVDDDLILILLDRLETSGNPRYVPLLEAWAEVESRKVKTRIENVIVKFKKTSLASN